jgi:hypothetical protein
VRRVPDLPGGGAAGSEHKRLTEVIGSRGLSQGAQLRRRRRGQCKPSGDPTAGVNRFASRWPAEGE